MTKWMQHQWIFTIRWALCKGTDMVCVTAVMHFSTLVHPCSLHFHDICIAISYGHRMSHRKQNVCLLPYFYVSSWNCHVRKCICFSHIIMTIFLHLSMPALWNIIKLVLSWPYRCSDDGVTVTPKHAWEF